MFSLEVFITYTLACLLLVISPGPAFVSSGLAVAFMKQR